MNVTCTGCPAKYSVPDEKVRGKKVRITCKHCGTNIVVDGSALGASASANESVLPQVEPAAAEPARANPVAAAPKAAAPTPLASPATAAPAAAAKPALVETTWLVGFIDDRQEPHTTSSVVELYAARKIDHETLVWKDGMDDWLPPFDVPELAAALKQRGVSRVPSFAALDSDDEPTVVGRSLFDDQTVVSSAPSEAILAKSAPSPAAPAVAAAQPSTSEIKSSPAAIRQSTPELKPSPAASRQSAPEIQSTAAKPVAARRAEKRPEVDLFGGVASAGSEADVSLDFGAREEPAHKMTGARNESSVLFSLDALTKPDPKTAGQKSKDKEKEKQASAALFGDNAPDSLMNMGGGGLAALTAPDFTKPVAAAPEPVVRPSDPVEVPNLAPGKKKGSAGLVIGVVIGIAAAAGLAFVFLSKKPVDKPADVATPETKSAAAPTPLAATTDTAAPSPAPEGTSSAAVGVASAASATASGALGASAAGAASAKAIGGTTATTAAPSAPGTSAALAKPADKPAEAKKPDAPAAPAAGADFDKGAAVAALSAAAASAASCKKPDGPTGGGKASVTFAPSGRATNSTVSGAFAGTEVGGCVARVFRSAKVPPFAGDPVTVSKSFSIQ